MGLLKRLSELLKGPDPTSTEPATELDRAAAKLSRISGKPLRPYATRDFGREQNPDARSIVMEEELDARMLVEEMREKSAPGLVVFVGCTRSLADPPDQGSEVVVAEGTAPLDIIRVAACDAVNYNLETEDLVRELSAIHARQGIDVVRAETDTIEFRLLNLPTDLLAFCEDLYRLCPDIVDQGVGSVEELAREIEKTKTVILWWD